MRSSFKLLGRMTDSTMKTYGGWADAFSGSGQAINGLGGIATGVTGIIGAEAKKAAKEAQILQTEKDATLEVLRIEAHGVYLWGSVVLQN